ncbi:SDR family oxidoreductase [Paucilactobacillus nenjiangensis]|jgi:uncharacterized protein YbjT (DUF2867 family)|uniref:SDR family oxidoreductase n=1 Tax=Paucilactobacillus nenjiangensis TaxID=1296540 RepID=UPI0010F7C46E|nr:SDR family oxidoreductase [Paucilactobacillus nenjiangensis]
MKYAITGATGNLGGQIIEQMLKLAEPAELIALVHTPAKAQVLVEQGIAVRPADYLNVASMTQALIGVDVLVYVPSKTYDVVQRVTELQNTLQAMKLAHVDEIVFMSFFADQENNPFVMSPYYGFAPRALAASSLKYTVAKNSLYADPLVPYLPELIERQNVIYPVGNQKMAFISLEESAEAFANLAVKPQLRNHGETYLLSQKKAYTMIELAAIMSEVTGKPIGYQPVTLQEFADIYESDGDGSELSSMYAGGAKGLLSEVSNDFEKITGHQPSTMKDFLYQNYRK